MILLHLFPIILGKMATKFKLKCVKGKGNVNKVFTLASIEGQAPISWRQSAILSQLDTRRTTESGKPLYQCLKFTLAPQEQLQFLKNNWCLYKVNPDWGNSIQFIEVQIAIDFEKSYLRLNLNEMCRCSEDSYQNYMLEIMEKWVADVVLFANLKKYRIFFSAGLPEQSVKERVIQYLRANNFYLDFNSQLRKNESPTYTQESFVFYEIFKQYGLCD
jgi:hypothetical protein